MTHSIFNLPHYTGTATALFDGNNIPFSNRIMYDTISPARTYTSP